MKRKPAAAVLLRQFCRGRTQAQLKAMFALIRAQSDRELLKAPAKRKAAAKNRSDPLVADLQHIFRPVLANAAEKGALLIEHMAPKGIGVGEPRGLADAVRRLRTRFSANQIRAAARALVEELAALYSKRETVI